MADHSFHQNRINRKEEVEKAYSTKIMKNNVRKVRQIDYLCKLKN